MAAPTAREAIEHKSYLENLAGEREMRERTRRIHEEYAMRGTVEFSDYVARGSTRTLPLADLIDMAYSLQAERHGYQTAVVLTARDKTPQTTVDRIERWLSIRTAQHLKRFMLQDEGGWHQLMSYAATLTWCHLGPRSPQYSRAESVNPLTFFFPCTGAPIRPREYAREFEMQVTDVGPTYADRGKEPYLDKSGNWAWYTPGADREPDRWSSGSTGKYGHSCRVVISDNGYYTTVVALNKRNGGRGGIQGGEILWQDKNRGGLTEDGQPASQAVIIPGMIQPMRDPADRLLPAFIPGIQAQHCLNYLVSLMASKVENSKTDVLVETTADDVLAAQRRGELSTRAVTLEPGVPNLIDVAGKPLLWNELPIPFLLDLLNFWKDRFDRWSNSLREISDPTLLSEINTNVYLPHSSARRRLLRPLNDFMNAGLAELLRMDIMALQYMGRGSVDVYATGNEYQGKGFQPIDVGAGASIAWEDVKDWDNRFVLTIATNDLSDEERRQMLQAHEEKVMMGYATKRQGISVAGYADEESQVMVLAEDEVYMEGTALVKPQIPKTIQQAIYYSGGILLPLADEQQATPAAAPGGGASYQGAVVPGGAAASAPAVAQAAPAPAPVGA